MKVDFIDLRKWAISKEKVSFSDIIDAFDMADSEALSALQALIAIGVLNKTPLHGEPEYYEVMDGDDDLVEIHSLTSIWSRVENEPDSSQIAVLSFSDDADHFPDFPETVSHYKVILEDIDYPSVTDFDAFFKEADDVAKWIDTQIGLGKRILCQCEYGISRSAASAAAILEAYHFDGIKIFSSFEYKPNKLIFKKLLTALSRAQQKPY